MSARLAIVATHPIQYYAPWFAYLAQHLCCAVRVFYLWDFGVTTKVDNGFGVELRWDIPLLEGYEYEFVPNVSGRPGTDTFFGLRNPSLASRLRAWNPDAVLFTAYSYASIVELLLTGKIANATYLFRGDSHRIVQRTGMTAVVRRLLTRTLFRRVDAALYVGSANREYFRLHGVADDCLFYSPHAVDNKRFVAARASARSEAVTWRSTLGIPESHRVVLFAGKFEEKKRPLDLLRAFAGAKLDNASLLFVGAGPQEAALREASSGQSNVFFAPFQNQTRMPVVYAASDVFVLPSFGPNETWGLSVNEAMCMGKPVIVSSHVGCARDLVLPGKTGLIFPAGDVAALSCALQTSFGDSDQLGAWGTRASEHIRAYSYENATAGLVAALRFLGLQAE